MATLNGVKYKVEGRKIGQIGDDLGLAYFNQYSQHGVGAEATLLLNENEYLSLVGNPKYIPRIVERARGILKTEGLDAVEPELKSRRKGLDFEIYLACESFTQT